MMTDPIADMLTRIRNAALAHKHTVVIPHSKVKKAIADIFVQEGYAEGVRVDESGFKHLEMVLTYNGKQPVLQSLKRESKPGHRMYRKAEELPRVLNDYGIAIVSTPKGIMTNKQARKEGIGGEVICSLY